MSAHLLSSLAHLALAWVRRAHLSDSTITDDYAFDLMLNTTIMRGISIVVVVVASSSLSLRLASLTVFTADCPNLERRFQGKAKRPKSQKKQRETTMKPIMNLSYASYVTLLAGFLSNALLSPKPTLRLGLQRVGVRVGLDTACLIVSLTSLSGARILSLTRRGLGRSTRWSRSALLPLLTRLYIAMYETRVKT